MIDETHQQSLADWGIKSEPWKVEQTIACIVHQLLGSLLRDHWALVRSLGHGGQRGALPHLSNHSFGFNNAQRSAKCYGELGVHITVGLEQN